MHWTEPCIILSTKPYTESARIITVFNRTLGKTAGLLKSSAVVQVGDISDITWRGRSSESLGAFHIDSCISPFAIAMQDSLKIYSIDTCCALCLSGLPERAPHEKLFDELRFFLSSLSQKDWLKNYVFFELKFLAEVGFGLNLSSCAVTGRPDIYYLSPKTGRGVIKEVGEEYKDKLFVIPKFLLDESAPSSYHDIFSALQITTHFLNTYFYDITGQRLPLFRDKLVADIYEKARGE